MMHLVRALMLLSLLNLAVIVYSMMRMGERVKPGTQAGARGFYPLFLKDDDFTDADGIRFRTRFHASLASFLILLLTLGVAISFVPEGAAPWSAP